MMGARIPLMWRAGSDLMGICILAVGSILRGVFYLPAIVPEGHKIPAIQNVAPLELWAGVWIALGIFGLVSLFAERMQSAAIGLLVAINVAWALLYSGAWIAGVSDRGYITSLSYWIIALLTLWAFGRGRLKQ